jgi:hypothetical protein
MAQNTLQQIPFMGEPKTVAELTAYIKKLYSTLTQWQLSLNNTKFLGSADGHLTISTVVPESTDGHDKDLWIKV